MTCPSCQSENPAGNKFCGQCGSRLAVVCSGCGTEAPEGAKFCGECGDRLIASNGEPPRASSSDIPLSPSPRARSAPAASPPSPIQAPIAAGPSRPDPAPESERRQVTVLSMVVSFDAGGGDEAEQKHALLDRFFRHALDEVARYEGTVHQLAESRLVALFGAPAAHEDHAWRALLLALGLRDMLDRWEDEAEQDGVDRMRLGCGIATGLLVTGGVGGLVVGEALQQAERLRDGAGDGEIRIATSTARQIDQPVELEPVTEATDGEGGGDPPGGAYRVLGRGRSELPPRLARNRSLSPFVGRDRELSALLDLAARASAGEGQVVGISGIAGSGKTRMVHELAGRLREREPLVRLNGRCLSYGQGVPYLPIVHMVRQASGIDESDGAREIEDKLSASLETIGTERDEVLPYLLHLLDVDLAGRVTHGGDGGDGGDGRGGLGQLEPQTLQNRTFAALRRMVLDASRSKLVVVELEDLHWIDATSEAFLDSLVETIGAARVLVLATYRSGHQPAWLSRSYASQLTMLALSTDDSLAVVEAVLGAERDDDARESLARTIVRKADGNPFFLEELVRMTASSGSRQGDEAEMLVPETVQGLLMARIDRLPEDQRRLLKAASVLGRELSPRLLERVWDRAVPIGPLVDGLRHQELLDDLPGAKLAFKHALTQEVAYGSLVGSRRRALHLAAARALEEMYADHLEEAYDQLVFHYPRAGDAEKTIHYLTLFAQRAAERNAHPESAAALRQALEVALDLNAEEGDDRARRDRRVVEILLQLADSLFPLARFEETLDRLDRHRTELAALDDPALAARFDFWLAHTHSYLGDQAAAREAALRSIAAAQEAADEAIEGRAHYVLGRDDFWSGDLTSGLERSLRAVVLLERSGEIWWQGQAHWVAGFHNFLLGRVEAGFSEMERAAAIGEALEDYRLDPSWSVGYFLAALGDWEAGIDQCRKGLLRAQDPLNRAAALGFLGFAYLEKGDYGSALTTLEQATEQVESMGMQPLIGWFTTLLAKALLATGRTEDARERVERSLAVCRDSGFRYGAALARRTLGRVDLDDGRPQAGRDRLTDALAEFEALEAAFEAARTRLHLAAAFERLGEDGRASEQILAASRQFDRLGLDRYREITRRRGADLGLDLSDLAAS